MSTPEEQEKLVSQFVEQLSEIVEEAEYDELWGNQLDPKGSFYKESIAKKLATKFLRANRWDLELAKKQLTNTLIWRKEFNPLSAGFREKHDEKFDILGVITYHSEQPVPNIKLINWNLYGNVKDPKSIFEDLPTFMRWRVGLMEQALQMLSFDDDTNEYMVQIHDYKNVAFLKLDPSVKKGSKSVIEIFTSYYPEVMSRKYFVNVPLILSWVYTLVKTFVPKETSRKFQVLSNSKDIASSLGDLVPTEYGGKGNKLEDQRFNFNKSGREAVLSEYAAYLLQKQFTEELD
ncbi:Non-classical phosphatidylinositol transfer protein (PITP) [Komagataella phaffii CBS 7435]|uniref:Phosphatidylinositol transfer protein SFH5 n=2 Tax=Komagataella phaffii TaxID=460519 RepID=C4R2X9_KOMPG|nr:Putative phosphatidylinositol transfer protein (PITP) [Komagataella phaffii GS115]AOA62229.1 GQ67_01270T0 [Komagataella phaffii]CAH2447590.1 Non-classical phosphatidylinositol transfer protein (PITP) [Komagataella phaffii CBS 7435]AOA67054.1 GQ68_00120T0 [Komagataella phaffii GS115]CAY69853.1 Putative phosphatidylinositol transfer protein (PITP) [Komagataella phaffii GS115]CCA37781.1 Non-classical phosphatidylinositol transfer protein (PITP) [Komagataella phaffii CBS 7435]